jgi:hypothetical protein
LDRRASPYRKGGISPSAEWGRRSSKRGATSETGAPGSPAGPGQCRCTAPRPASDGAPPPSHSAAACESSPVPAGGAARWGTPRGPAVVVSAVRPSLPTRSRADAGDLGWLQGRYQPAHDVRQPRVAGQQVPVELWFEGEGRGWLGHLFPLGPVSKLSRSGAPTRRLGRANASTHPPPPSAAVQTSGRMSGR